ncbi:MAG TPA: cysteine--tRNA ligase [Gammaproteobacteria bacterium]|nr:cysteine--tRNA ligase [Gammaproteobacteria bacterium]
MSLQIYNSLKRAKQPFQPLEEGKVRMYVCGLTVYDYMHMGHARMLVVFDMVARYLRARGYELTYVRNITDIDDKIIRRAAENDETFSELTQRMIAATHEDEAALGVLRPDVEPRATESIDAMIRMIEKLVADDYAYVVDNGDVNYAVSRFAGYGKLSGKRVDELRAGARVEVGEGKRDPVDFVLWKAAKPGEPSWPSPWGDGRPGWHIECSAMSTRALGNHFDIHGGGMDLQFPHHENEIAQSEAATGETFVNVWMHNGFVQVDEEKMSKSLGNFFTVRDVLKRYRPEDVRYFILASHYRSPLNYSDDNLANAHASLERLYTALRGVELSPAAEQSAERERFFAAMDDDFNTPLALSVLFDLARDINRLRDADPEAARQQAGLLKELGGVLGLLQDDPERYLRAGAPSGGLADEDVERLIEQRAEARRQRDFAAADRVRDELAAQGVVLEDRPGGGTDWRRE